MKRTSLPRSSLIFFLLLFYSMQGRAQAKFEPDSGCYIGAFIANDANVQGDIDTFERLTGKQHAIYFSYTGYGSPFPGWVKTYGSKNTIVQIAFEPNGGLDQVVDGSYIHEWARAARATRVPILLRWACEMNGSWVAWYGNPSLYIEKFRLIATIMKQEAPNVAMVWAPNDIPNDPSSPPNYIHSYYPGDEYVDWVGIDFYGVYYYESGAQERTDPRVKLRKVYDVYSARKPIMVCEWAATHYSTRVTPPESCVTYAIDQMNALYTNAQSEFPRLKAICWFDMNSLTTNKCNFSLTDNAQVLANYKTIIQSLYFLSVPQSNVPFLKLTGLSADTVLRTEGSFSVTIDCLSRIDSVVLAVDGMTMEKSTAAPYRFGFHTGELPDGEHSYRITAFTSSGTSNYEDMKIVIDKTGDYSVQIIDNVDPGFSTIGSWSLSTSQPDRYGANYSVSPLGTGTNKATWTFSVPRSGRYFVNAYWSVHSNRADNAPYIVTHANGIDTIRVNQKINGGIWNRLGDFQFIESSLATVTLTNDANGYVIADAVKMEWRFPTSIEHGAEPVPASIVLYQNYPNPFNPSTIIEFRIQRGGFVMLKVYDLLGREVVTLVNGKKTAGTYSVTWNASKMPTGVYFYSLQSGEFTATKKLLLIR